MADRVRPSGVVHRCVNDWYGGGLGPRTRRSRGPSRVSVKEVLVSSFSVVRRRTRMFWLSIFHPTIKAILVGETFFDQDGSQESYLFVIVSGAEDYSLADSIVGIRFYCPSHPRRLQRRMHYLVLSSMLFVGRGSRSSQNPNNLISSEVCTMRSLVHGVERTIDILKAEGIQWKGMNGQVDHFIKKCLICQKTKPHRHKALASWHYHLHGRAISGL
jgi:hypothetical protein